eukprot:PhM_4_TR16521/c0_g1_i1/m.36851/K10415/DYNC1I, DNCI; dynein intermediate chain, cytosolic
MSDHSLPGVLEEKRRRIEQIRLQRQSNQQRAAEPAVPVAPAVAPRPTAVNAQALLADVVSAAPAAPAASTTPHVTLVTSAVSALWSLMPQPEKESYSKEVQTTVEYSMLSPRGGEGVAAAQDSNAQQQPAATALDSPSGQDGDQILSNASLERSVALSEMDEESRQRLEQLEREVEQQKRAALLNKDSFLPFVERATQVMERALKLNNDMFFERAAGTYDCDVAARHDKDLLHKLNFFDDDGSMRNCAVTSLSFQPGKNSEFFLASYRELNARFGQSSEGFALGWSVHLQRPAFKLTSPTDVSTVQYCPFRPNIVIGGTYSGQVVLWDTRKGSAPVVITPVTKETHTNPIFGINVIGATASHQLITVSNDGRMCTWNMDKMTVPVEKSTLQYKEEVGDTAINKPITCTSVDFSNLDVEKFFVGGENGTMYSSARHAAQSSLNKAEGHACPVSAVHCHPVVSSDDAEIGNLVLSSSLDWSCKLWYEERTMLTPLGTFSDYTEYVYDVKWSPTHPSLFATGDGNGIVSLWNLSRPWGTPVAKFDVTNEDATAPAAVNRLAWSPDGDMIAAGDNSGGVTLLGVSGATPSDDDMQRLRQNVMSAHHAAAARQSRSVAF